MKKQIQKKLLFTLIAIAVFSCLNAQIAPALAAQLQQILNNRVQAGSKGVSACVIMPNGNIWKGSSGVGQNSVTITDTTIFHGASITKANIATLILLLAENNLLHLDSCWTKYVSLNASFNPSITIRQLLNHTSGIADYLETPATETLVTSNYNHAFTPTEILENIVSGTPAFAPGTNFLYSTSNYALLALIAQTVTGNPVQQELRSRIWAPLGMTHTYFGGFESYTEPRAGVWWDFGSGIQNYSNNPETSMLTYGFGGANIVSTPQDLAFFARALFTGTLLSAPSLNQMKIFTPNSYPFWNGYGLGVHRIYSGTVNTLGHDGYYTNMSDMFHSYDYGFTLVTMTNTWSQLFGVYNPMYNAIKNFIITGISDNSALLPVKLYPNPAAELLLVDLGANCKNVVITIYDIAGRLICSVIRDEAQTLDVNTRDFSAGAYTVKIQTDGFMGTKKLIITK